MNTEPSSREQQVAVLISRGRSVKQIADELRVSPRTVATHRMNLYRKLGCTNQGHMVRIMIERGFLEVGRNG
jgi:DNA-binding NarL/FixJ family response regulator